jgi:hypothetical protein
MTSKSHSGGRILLHIKTKKPFMLKGFCCTNKKIPLALCIKILVLHVGMGDGVAFRNVCTEKAECIIFNKQKVEYFQIKEYWDVTKAPPGLTSIPTLTTNGLHLFHGLWVVLVSIEI